MDKEDFLYNDTTHYGDALLAIEGKSIKSKENKLFFCFFFVRTI